MMDKKLKEDLMKIDHVGYAVKDIERAKKSFEMLGFWFENMMDDPDRNVKLIFGENNGYRIELVQPLSKDKPSPVDTYLKSMGATPYHFCYSSDTFEEDIAELTEQGFRVIIEPQSAVALGGRRVVFMMDRGMGLFEIMEEGVV